MKRKLNIALTNNLQMANNADGKLPQPMVIAVRESLTRRHDNAFARMNTKRVNVLHVAHGDAIVGFISHDLVLHFLPAIEVFFHEDLWRIGQGPLDPFLQRPFVLAHARAQSSQRKCNSYHYRITDFGCRFLGLLKRGRPLGTRRINADLVKPPHEQSPVLRVTNRLNRRTEHTNAVSLQETTVSDFQSTIQRCLAAESHKNPVRFLFLYNSLCKVRVYW